MKSKEKIKKKTVGQQYIEEAWKAPDTRDPIELQRSMQEKYLENLRDCTLKFRKDNPNTDFFVVVLTKQERLMEKMFRFYYLARYSCPTPEYDQSVYHYKHKDESIEFVWCVPDQNTVSCVIRDEPYIPEHEDLVRMCFDFKNGELLRKAKKLNKEIN